MGCLMGVLRGEYKLTQPLPEGGRGSNDSSSPLSASGRGAGGRGRLLAEDGVEDADGLPGVLVLRDELLVPLVVLVLVVGGLVLEDNEQGDVEVLVVDRAVESGA